MLRRLLLTLTATTATLCTACGSSGTPGAPVTTTVTRAPSDPTSASTSRTPAPPLRPAQLRATARRELAAVAAHEPSGSISVAALNTKTGASFSAGATSGMWTASAYKLLLVEGLLARGSLSDAEAAEATTALENSDNVAGYQLFLDLGGRPGEQETLEHFGMTHSVAGMSDPTFTTTSATDYLKVLKNLVAPGPLSESARRYVLGLMHNVEPDQRWGVGVVADKGTTFANKNGWLSIDDSNGPGEDDDGRWAVTSVGIVTLGGDQVLMSVFTRHQPDFETGVHLVEQLARIIAPTVRG